MKRATLRSEAVALLKRASALQDAIYAEERVARDSGRPSEAREWSLMEGQMNDATCALGEVAAALKPAKPSRRKAP